METGAMGLIDESYCGTEIDAYGLTKLLGEKLLSESYLPSVSLRCPAILEVKNSNNLLSKIFDKCLKNQDINLFNGHRPFNAYISAFDIARFIHSLQSDNLDKHDHVNIASDSDVTLIQIVEIIRAKTKSSSRIENTNIEAPTYRLDTKRISKKYGFLPSNSIQMLEDWCTRRLEYMSRHVTDAI